MAMAEEDIAPSSSPVSSDHKRKLDDLEEEAPNRETSRPPSTQVSEANGKPDGVLEAVEVEEDEEDEERRSDVPEVKRLRLEEQSADGAEPTPQDQRTEAPLEEGGEPASTGIAQEAEEGLVSTTGNVHPDGSDELSPAAAGNLYPPDGSVPSTEQPQDLTQPTSRKIEVPNNKVGVLIGKAGDTIRLLQYNSGAKIQITRDADSDPYAATRPVELIGSLESITKAEHLIKDVIAEADAGGSPSLVARGFGAAQSGSEQVQIQVPNEKVGLIIGKGGETIKNLQTRSGARIQLIPQHLPDGDQSKERTVRVTGNKKQIETAREMIKEVMTQTPMKPSPLSSGYPQQSFRPRGPPGLPQWGLPRGPPPSAQPTNYDYQQRGMYPPQVGQYPPPAYGGYPQQPAPRTGFSPGWEQRPPTQTQGPPQSGAYDYYGQGGPPPSSAPAPGPTQAHSNYNYGQTQGSDYGQPHGYSQSVPPQQTYDNHAPIQHPYGASQQGYSQSAGAPSGYSQPYGRPPYGMPPTQGPPSHSYGPPRAAQPGDMQQYQGQPMSTAPSYASSGQPSQQSYPYGTNAPAQQPYPYGSTTGANDGYTQPVSVPAPGYGQQGGPSPYAQPTVGASQTGGYAQGGQVGGYAQYPSSQQGYGEQQTPSNPNYGGYQGSTDAGYASGAGSAYGAPPSGQQGYVQPPLNPPTYDQSIPQTGYGAHAGAAPVGYAKSLSPQPGYAQYAATAGTTATAGTAPDGQLYAQGHH